MEAVRTAIERVVWALGPLEGGRESKLDNEGQKSLWRALMALSGASPESLGLTPAEVLEELEPLREGALGVEGSTNHSVLEGRGSKRAEAYGWLADWAN